MFNNLFLYSAVLNPWLLFLFGFNAICSLHICIVLFSYATDLSARLVSLWAIDEEIGCQQNDR